MKYIGILYPEEFLSLFRNNVTKTGTATFIYDLSVNVLKEKEALISGLENKPPYNIKQTSFRNYFKKEKHITPENLTEVICFITERSKCIPKFKPSDKEKELDINHSLLTFQKIFALLDKSHLKEIDLRQNIRERYNMLLYELTNDKHEFGRVQIDKNWNIVGKKCVPVDEIEHYILELTGKSKQENSLSSNKEKEIFDSRDPNWRPEASKKIKKRSHVKKIVLIGILVGLGYLLYYKLQAYVEEQHRIGQERNIIENANSEKASRSSKLVSIYDAINKELSEDYNGDGVRNLSQELIGRIITLSDTFKPYLYLREGKILDKKLSPERADLFLTLYRSDLHPDVFSEIISKSNFTYADFSNSNLSNLHLASTMYGIEGHYNDEVQVLITPVGRPDFSYSDFSGANLSGTILYGTFSHCSFSNSFADSVFFVWSDLSNCTFEGSEYENCRFQYSSLNQSNFQNTVLGLGAGYGRGFFSCDLRGVGFDGSAISGGSEPFMFRNCFISSNGTYFNYWIDTDWFDSLYLRSYPYIDGWDNYVPLNAYEIVKVNKKFGENQPEPYTQKNIDRFVSIEGSENRNIYLNSGFRLIDFEENFDEKELWERISNAKTQTGDDRLFYYMVRTNDNVDRNFKGERVFASYFGHSMGYHDPDTLYVRSAFNKLQSEYRGLVYNHIKTKDSLTDGTASFKNCKFVHTQFKDMDMQYASFNASIFTKNTENISVKFDNVKLLNNDFRIESGVFSFSSLTSYDSLKVNIHFPLLKFIKDRDSLKEGSFNARMFSGNPFDASLHFNLSPADRKEVVDWIEINKDLIILDSLKQIRGEYLLKNSLKKIPEFKEPTI